MESTLTDCSGMNHGDSTDDDTSDMYVLTLRKHRKSDSLTTYLSDFKENVRKKPKVHQPSRKKSASFKENSDVATIEPTSTDQVLNNSDKTVTVPASSDEDTTDMFVLTLREDPKGDGMTTHLSNIKEDDLDRLEVHAKNEMLAINRPSRLVRCRLCHEKFKDSTLLMKHMGRFHCRVKKLLKTEEPTLKSEAIPRAVRHFIPKPFACECGKSFSSKYTLNAHSKIHSNLTFTCKCGQTFNTERSLRKHMFTYHKTNHLFECDKCKRKFVTKHELHLHILEHDRSSQCQTCGRRLKSEHNLQRHVRLAHTNLKKIQCEKCGLRFKRRFEFFVHNFRKHSAPGRYHCEHCSQQFVMKDRLRLHIMRFHCDFGKFQCDRCGLEFRSESLFNSHMEQHLEPLQCDWCTSTFRRKIGLAAHMRYHSSECVRCNLKYLTLYELKWHEGCHAGRLKPFQCKSSGNFITEKELRRHFCMYKEGGGIQCNCGKSFATENELIAHMLSSIMPQYSSRRRNENTATNCHVFDPGVKCDLCVVRSDAIPLTKINHPLIKIKKKIQSKVIPISTIKQRLIRARSKRKLQAEKNVINVECTNQYEPLSSLGLDHSYAIQCNCEQCKRKIKYGGYVKGDHSYLNRNGGVKKRKKKLLWKCKKCKIEFQSKNEWITHRREIHKIEQKQCERCSELFDSKNALKLHYRSHPLLKCSACRKRYRSGNDLETHLKLAHSNRQWHCSPCDKYFENQSILMEHIKIHSSDYEAQIESEEGNEKPSSDFGINENVLHKCPVCAVECESLADLSLHVFSHSNECVSYGLTGEGKLSVNTHCNHD